MFIKKLFALHTCTINWDKIHTPTCKYGSLIIKFMVAFEGKGGGGGGGGRDRPQMWPKEPVVKE